MSEPWLPWLEANQGTISVATLALALFAFIWELYRANTQRQRELEEEIEDAILLMEELERAIADETHPSENEAEIDEIQFIATSLRALAVAHVKKPTLSLPLLRAAHFAEYLQTSYGRELEEDGRITSGLSHLKGEVEIALKEARRRVVFRRREPRGGGQTADQNSDEYR